MALEVEKLDHRFLDAAGIRLHVAVAGPEQGMPVLLLHGFPEYWYGWRRQIPFLAEQGYRVWAPDLPGYNLSDKPSGLDAYRIDRLAENVLGLIEAMGPQRVRLVGHDWGGVLGWWLGATRPEWIERLVILNVPHPAVMLRHLRVNPRQWLKSWYILAFQLPWLPEALARAGNWRALVRALQKTSRPGAFSPEDLEEYRQAWSQPGAYTAMLNWYRAALRRRPKLPADPRIRVPTLLIWGVHDVALGRELAQPSVQLCNNGRLEFLDDATHWVQHDEPDRVNRLIDEFFSTAAEGGKMRL
jgi:pimeloyl-ACP methyl ester carboxylesterase